MTKKRTYIDQFALRLPDGWRDTIKEMAAKSRRSMNEEILFHLEGVVRNKEASKDENAS